MHDWDKPEISQLLAKSRAALVASGGHVFVRKVLLNADKSGPLPAAGPFHRGRCYSWREMADLLEEHDLRFIAYRESGGDRGVVIG